LTGEELVVSKESVLLKGTTHLEEPDFDSPSIFMHAKWMFQECPYMCILISAWSMGECAHLGPVSAFPEPDFPTTSSIGFLRAPYLYENLLSGLVEWLKWYSTCLASEKL
jgi:hypothetical protein